VRTDARRLSSFDDDDVICRTYDQIRMQDLFLSSTTRITYNDAFAGNQKVIMAYNRWTSLHFCAGICTPRRWGKSWALAMFIACLLYWVHNITICIYSPGLRAAGKADGLLGHVGRFLAKLGVKSNIESDSADHFKFRLNGSTREVKAFPGGSVGYVCLPDIILFPLEGIHHGRFVHRFSCIMCPGVPVVVARPRMPLMSFMRFCASAPSRLCVVLA
jgi:hypothetical protein